MHSPDSMNGKKKKKKERKKRKQDWLQLASKTQTSLNTQENASHLGASKCSLVINGFNYKNYPYTIEDVTNTFL